MTSVDKLLTQALNRLTKMTPRERMKFWMGRPRRSYPKKDPESVVNWPKISIKLIPSNPLHSATKSLRDAFANWEL